MILWSKLSYRKLLPTFILFAIHHKFSYFFSSCDIHQSHALLLDPMPNTPILHLSSFTCFVLLISIMPSCKSNMANSFRIIVVKLNIIQINIIRPIKAYAIAKECNNSRIYITKGYIIIRKKSIIKAVNRFACHKPIRTKF